MHKEDIKAELRKKHGTIRQFEIETGLPKGSVHEVLRNRRWSRIEKAIEAAIVSSSANLSEKSDNKRKSAMPHRKIVGGAV